MTPTLRKAHRYTWFGLAVLLPALWLASILAIPDTLWEEPVRAPESPALPVLVVSKQAGDMVLNLRQDTSGRQQLEVLLQKPLEQPNTVVILEGKTDWVLGQLNTRGIRRFALGNLMAATPLRLRIEDRIRQQVLYRVAF